MRCMMLMYPKIEETEWTPSADAVAEMMAYNEELTKAGVLLALDGLHPTAEGARVSAVGGKVTVTRGPFPDARDALGGYWVLQVASLQEAVDWASRCPLGGDAVVEVRRIYEAADFSADVAAEAKLSRQPPAQPVER